MPVPEIPQKLHRVLLRDDAYDSLRQDIISGRVRPGARLHVEAIAARLGVSRTPIHEALSKLAGDGFVEVRPQKETRVAIPSAATAADIVFVYRHIVMTLLPQVLPLGGASSPPEGADIRGEAGILDVCALLGSVIDAVHNLTLQRATSAIVVHLEWAVTVFPELGRDLAMNARAFAALADALYSGDAAGSQRLIASWSDGILRRARSHHAVASATGARVLLRDQVYASILEAFANGSLGTGERLREDQLMRWLGVSRTPVREALSRLERIGLVEVLPGRQTLVSPLNGKRLGEVLEALALFAELSMREGVPLLGAQERALLVQRYGEMEKAAAVGNFAQAVMVFTSAQRVATQACESKALVAIVDSVSPWLYKRVEVTLSTDADVVRDYAVVMQAAVQCADGPVAATATGRLLRDAARSLPFRAGHMLSSPR